MVALTGCILVNSGKRHRLPTYSYAQQGLPPFSNLDMFKVIHYVALSASQLALTVSERYSLNTMSIHDLDDHKVLDS